MGSDFEVKFSSKLKMKKLSSFEDLI